MLKLPELFLPTSRLWLPGMRLNPLGRFGVCENCCDDTAPVSDRTCYGCNTDHVPLAWVLTLAGFEDNVDGCDTCVVLNDTFILDLMPTPPDNCVWEYDFDPDLALPNPVSIYYEADCLAGGWIWNGSCWECDRPSSVYWIRMAFSNIPPRTMIVELGASLSSWAYIWRQASLPSGDCDTWTTPFNVPLYSAPSPVARCGDSPTCYISAYVPP